MDFIKFSFERLVFVASRLTPILSFFSKPSQILLNLSNRMKLIPRFRNYPFLSCMLFRMVYHCASQVTAATLKGEALLPPDSPATERTTMTVSRHYSRRSTTTTTATPRRGDNKTSSQNKVESVSCVEIPPPLPPILRYIITVYHT